MSKIADTDVQRGIRDCVPSGLEDQSRQVSFGNSLFSCESDSAKSAKGTKSAVMTWWMALTCSEVGSMSSEGPAPRNLAQEVNISGTLDCGRRASSEFNAAVWEDRELQTRRAMARTIATWPTSRAVADGLPQVGRYVDQVTETALATTQYMDESRAQRLARAEP